MGAIDENALIARCLSGEPRAFDELVAAYERIVFTLALRMIGDREEARDVTQVVFLKVHRGLASYDRRRRFFSWIYRIAVNECLNARRGRRVHEGLDERLVDPAPTQEEQAMRREVADAVQVALQRLPEADREVLVLRHWLERSYAEMADALGLPESTIKSRLFEARQRLGRLLRTEGVQA